MRLSFFGNLFYFKVLNVNNFTVSHYVNEPLINKDFG